MTYQSVHTGAEVDAAVAVLNDVQEIRDEVDAAKGTVVNLAGQVQTDAGNASSDAATALQAASDALDSKNAAYASEQAASGHAANADSARAQAVVARNGAEDALGEALNAESRMIELLSDSGPTVDELRAAIRRIHYGDGPYPSLDLNFVGATMLDPRITFTRVSAATYWDAMGVLRTAQENEPRFDYDPITGKSLGLLVEGQATNLLRWSEDYASPSWAKADLILTPGLLGPDGNPSATKIHKPEVAGPYKNIGQNFNAIAGQDYCLSFFAKADSSDKVSCLVSESTSGTPINGRVVFDLSTVTVGAAPSTNLVSYGIKPVGYGWFFLWMVVTINSTATTSRAYIYPGVFDQGVEASVLIFGTQVEQGTSPTSYIKTEGSQVTRTVGTSSISVDDFSFNQDAFTFVVGWELNESGPSFSYTPIFKIGNEGNTVFRGIGFRQRRDNWNVHFSVRDNNQPDAGLEMFSIPGVQGRNIAAFSFDRSTGQLRASVNGSAVQSGIFPGEFDEDFLRRIFLTSAGRISGAETPEYFIKLCRYQGLSYFPRAFSDAKLVELTTP